MLEYFFRFILYICYYVLQDSGMRQKSPIGGDLSPQVQPYVNQIQELVRISHQMFQDSCVIPWDATLFSVGNGGIPLYITMQDVFEIIQGNQLLNIIVIQLWMM